MKLKPDFREHLIWVRDSINFVLGSDRVGRAECTYNLYSSLIQLMNYIWRETSKSTLLKK